MDLIWLYIVVGIATVLVAWIFISRFFDTANKSVTAVAGTANEAVDALRPVASAVGNAIEGAGSILHGAGSVVSSFAYALRNKQRERAQLSAENASLKAEIEQLKGRQINATAIEQQLQVAFFSIKSKYTSFKRMVNGKDDGGWFGLDRPTSREFLSIIDASFTTKVGVDLRKLRFGMRPGSTIVQVFGAHEVEPIGLSDLSLNSPFSEARAIRHATDLRGEEVEILQIDKELERDRDVHHREVLEGIQKSELTSSLAEANEKVALGFFRVLMGAGRYEFVAAREPIDGALTFQELCDAINSSISENIAQLESSAAIAHARVEALDNEILEAAIYGASARGQLPGVHGVDSRGGPTVLLR